MATGIPARLNAAEGRRFAWTVGAAFLVLAAVFVWRNLETAASVAAGIGTVLALAGLLVPWALTPVYRAWMGLARVISKVTTPIFLGIVYFVVIMPIGLLMRMLGRNPMVHPVRSESYFVDRAPGTTRRSNLERQF
jgi:hypothetical protein